MMPVLTPLLALSLLLSAEPDRQTGGPREGGAVQRFWSFRPVVRSAPPSVQRKDWVRNPIDAFVLARLEAARLSPASPANKTSLLRRVYYDLIGLPPTTAEVDAFLADEAPDAYEKVVDRLLASPHHGERWARHWLDLVRYGETNGFERNSPKPFVWRYRDYVIRSFNEDKPYDQFIREQLAGDELEPVTDETLIATGYYRVGPWDDEPADREQALYDDLDDILATTGQVFLGLTIQCARCHDHKFDPLSQLDYYRLLAFFNGIQRYGVRSPDSVAAASLRPIASPAQQERHKEEIAAYHDALNDLTRKMQVIEDAVRPHLGNGEREDFVHEQHRTAILRKHIPDLLTLKMFDTYVELRQQREAKQKAAPPSMAQALCVSEIGPTPRETFVLGRGNYRNRGAKVEPGIPAALRWEPQLPNAETRAPDRPAHPAASSAGLRYWIALLLPIAILGVYSTRKPLGAKRSQNTLAAAVLFGLVLWVSVNSIRTLRTIVHRFNSPLTTESQRAAIVTRPEMTSAPALAEPKATASATCGRRRALADWIANPKNPLTARVLVNRVWQYHFGRGIVRSSSDFGTQGTPPTHPELLDWLASEFVAGGMRLKPLHKLIVMSNTYRISTQAARNAPDVDPRNDLFSRFELRRLSAEEIRDAILAVSGNLNGKMGGPSIYPQIPHEVLSGQSNPAASWDMLCPADERNRRSIYVHVRRSLPVPLLAAFDAADTDSSCSARFATTQPAQALAMLNSDFLHGQAACFAEDLCRHAANTPSQQVRLALWRVWQREPSLLEITRGVQFLTKMRIEFKLAEAEALRSFCLMALNFNELLYID
jgi:hypothetical protein